MAICNVFPVINLSATGRRIERSRKAAGLTVRDVQTYFGFEYPQAVYKWQHGECLPSVDNLLALSRLLQVPMEDLLVYEDQEVPLVFGTNAEEMSRTWPLENEPFRKMAGRHKTVTLPVGLSAGSALVYGAAM